MKYKIPKTMFGIPVEGAMERLFAKLDKAESEEGQQPQTTNNLPPTSLENPEDYIFLQGKTHGTYSYPDLLVSMYRLGMNSEVETVANQLGYNLSNTAKENNNREYIGNINWKQALSLNCSLGGFTLNPRQFADFLLLLKSGNVQDGKNRKVPKSKLDEILDEILTVRDPYREEWLDADFKYINNRFWLYSDHQIVNSGLEAGYKKELESCLMTKGDKINLSTMNNQGLPVTDGNDFHYWCPDKDNKSVARFDSDSVRASLSCSWDPASPGPSLGVRCCVGAEGAREKFRSLI